jgi:hypothetical protein
MARPRYFTNRLFQSPAHDHALAERFVESVAQSLQAAGKLSHSSGKGKRLRNHLNHLLSDQRTARRQVG